MRKSAQLATDKVRAQIGTENEEAEGIEKCCAHKMKSRVTKKMAMEPPKLREKRLRKLREYQRRYYANLSPEKKAARLARQRELMRRYYSRVQSRRGKVSAKTASTTTTPGKRPRGRPRKYPNQHDIRQPS